MNISQSAIDLIIAEEVSSKAYYEKHYTHPEWPGGSSGITVGVGYDLGYATKTKISQDFRGKVSDNMLLVMQRCAGVSGAAAASLLHEVKSSIDIPWDVGMDVFMNRDVLQWISIVNKAVPNCEFLNPTCLGVLVSLAYNRGAAGFNSSTDRNREMKAIRDLMAAKRFNEIPNQFRAMARLWPGVSGLQGRRYREAKLFEQGLAQGATVVPTTKDITPVSIDPSIVSANRIEVPARTPAPTTTPIQHTTTAAIVVAGGAAVNHVATHGYSMTTAVLIGVLVLVVAATTWFAFYKNQNPK